MHLKRGYVESRDGTRIRFQAIGAGRPLFCCNGLGVPIYFWRHLAEEFLAHHQIICWDYRGHGRSDLPPDKRMLHFDDLLDDGMAVLKHLDVEDAIGIGHSVGFQVLLGLYERAPERFSALASFLGTYGRPLSCLFDSPMSRTWFDLFYVITVYYPGLVNQCLELLTQTSLPYYLGGLFGVLNLSETRRHDLQVYLENIRGMDPIFFATMTQGAEAHTAEHILSTVKVPTLLIAAANDKFVPLRITKQMHRKLPHSELFVIPEGSHAGLFECPELFNQRLAQFLWKHRLSPETSAAQRQHRRVSSGRK